MDQLTFPVNDFILKTAGVELPSGGKSTVRYRAYEHIPYVSKPVDLDYQSMDILVPVEIDGRPVDASYAPILMHIGVGGYMSCRNRNVVPMKLPPMPDGKIPTPPGEDIKDLALANGFVVAAPGCRGRDNQAADGTYYGKAPAAIVDLKAAVRYLRHNAGLVPGDPEHIVSNGGSAGGALSCLLAVTGNHPAYDGYLEEIGAARERDNTFGAAAFSPIINLENADGAYEWEFGPLPMLRPGLREPLPPVDQALSHELRDIFVRYQDELAPQGKNGFGKVGFDKLEDYLLKEYLFPSAQRFLDRLDDDKRAEYLSANPWISCENGRVEFAFRDYVLHFGRMKGLPAFDDFDMEMAEPIEFGSRTVNARHFTPFSIRHCTGDDTACVPEEIERLLYLMNPMYFIDNEGSARHWWIRHGACDNHTALPIVTNFADLLAADPRNHVSSRLVWDGGHCADDDPEGLIRWIRDICKG